MDAICLDGLDRDDRLGVVESARGTTPSGSGDRANRMMASRRGRAVGFGSGELWAGARSTGTTRAACSKIVSPSKSVCGIPEGPSPVALPPFVKPPAPPGTLRSGGVFTSAVP